LLFSRFPAPGGAGGVGVAPDGSVYATLGTAKAALARFTIGGTLDHVWDLSSQGAGPTAVVASATTAYVLVSNPAAVLAVSTTAGEARKYAAIPDVSPCVLVIRTTDELMVRAIASEHDVPLWTLGAIGGDILEIAPVLGTPVEALVRAHRDGLGRALGRES